MAYKTILIGIGIALTGSLLGSRIAHASNQPNLRFNVDGIECTIDEIYDQESIPAYIINPEDCTEPPIRNSLDDPVVSPNEDIASLPIGNTARIRTSESANYNLFQKLSFWFGLNDPTSPVPPFIFGVLAVGSLSLVISALFSSATVTEALKGFMPIRRKR